jgi:mono/diheme cytochrome c family protein
MAETAILGLFHEATSTSNTVEGLHDLGISDNQITIMSGMPYRAEMLGLPKSQVRVGLIALLGGILGLSIGAFLSIGIFLLYPLVQGGQPVVPIPPTLIVLFEMTMLGTMWASFFGLLGENRFPVFRSEIYDPRITEGHIGLLVRADESKMDDIENLLVKNGAHHIRREFPEIGPDKGLTAFWATVAVLLIVVTSVVVFWAYDVIKISFPTQMENQESIAYVEGPRLAAPDSAVPVQGPVLIDGRPATEPLPSTQDSLQRGKILFERDCVMCHGATGQGNGLVGAFFNPHPADLTSDRVQSLPPEEIYLVITFGRGLMPSIAENLDRTERWDVINYVYSLKP